MGELKDKNLLQWASIAAGGMTLILGLMNDAIGRIFVSLPLLLSTFSTTEEKAEILGVIVSTFILTAGGISLVFYGLEQRKSEGKEGHSSQKMSGWIKYILVAFGAVLWVSVLLMIGLIDILPTPPS